MQNTVKLLSYVDHKMYEFLEEKIVKNFEQISIFTG